MSPQRLGTRAEMGGGNGTPTKPGNLLVSRDIARTANNDLGTVWRVYPLS